MEIFIHKKRTGGLKDFLVLCIKYRKLDPWIQLYCFWMQFLSM